MTVHEITLRYRVHTVVTDRVGIAGKHELSSAGPFRQSFAISVVDKFCSMYLLLSNFLPVLSPDM